MNTMARSNKQSKSGRNNDDDGRIGAATGKQPVAVEAAKMRRSGRNAIRMAGVAEMRPNSDGRT